MHTVLTDCDQLWLNAQVAAHWGGVDASTDASSALVAMGVKQGRIALLAPMSELAAMALPAGAIDLAGAWVTPALIDCHTHAVFGGNRAQEWEMRLCGVPYAEIARQGGGILSTVRATRALNEADLLAASLPRVQALAAEGVGCIEIKSGYGLTLDDELKMLRVAHRLGELAQIDVSATLLAAHAVPPEYTGRADDYVSLICNDIIPAVAEAGLAEAVDVFCEHIAFTRAQAERLFVCACQHGLAVKGHMEQLSDLDGSALAAQYGAWSVDHVEFLSDAGIDALARSGTVAVLLPAAFYFLREKQLPPIAALRAAGVPMAVATDLNPGTSPFASIRLAMNMACVLFGLTPQQAFAGVTQHAARALGRATRLGRLAVGYEASFCVWQVQHPAELAYQMGVNPLRYRVWRGQQIAH
ncbi:imidazolonepropionase [Chitinivorax tropicus]|uniref:Imidazolonepropionase n=1 Tax=Chitinivorax tropicus TaxID=714531 RepID=A0A840MRT8_9PROT|nr:imidazolonepropionase [Chitinivorax tropicus]MBB5019492.1 imidazolonepropionase [Chitinivorax tropicus]